MIQVTSHGGSSPKLASGLLRLIGVKTRPAAVCPPLLLSLQLQLLHGSGLHFMKSGGALAAKIIGIIRQHTPTARLCSPRAIRSRKERRLVSWTQTMHKNYFLAFFAYLGFQVANIFTYVYWPSELVTKINASLSSWSLEGFQIFEIRQTLECSWCMILSRLNLSILYDNKGICLSYSSYLASSNKCL